MSTAILATGLTPTYITGPAIDIAETPYYNIRNLAGLAFWGRADGAVDDVGSGYKAQLPDKRTGSARLLRQPTGQTATMTKQTAAGYLRNRANVLWTADTDGMMAMSEDFMPTTGAWAIYLAVHLLTPGYNRLLGNNGGSQLAVNQVNNEWRLAVAGYGSGASVTAAVAAGLQNKDVLVGFFRRTVSTSTKLAVRYKFAGQAWQDVEAASYCTSDGLVGGTARSIAASLLLGVHTTPAASYAFNGRLAQLLVFNADVGSGSGSVREKVEEYLTNYHGMS